MLFDSASTNSSDPSVLRGLIAQHWPHPLYQLAVRIGLHPCRLSSVLHGKVPMPPGLADRITRTIEKGTTDAR